MRWPHHRFNLHQQASVGSLTEQCMRNAGARARMVDGPLIGRQKSNEVPAVPKSFPVQGEEVSRVRDTQQ